MKRLINLIYFVPFMAFAQFEGSKQTFESPNLKEAIASHKMVAILPFDVKITYRKQPKNFNLEANRDQETKMSKSIQGSLYTYLLRHAQDYPVTLQNVDETNLRLKRAGMAGNLDKFTKMEIAAALGVDALLVSRFETRQTQSDGVAIAAMALIGGAGGRTGTGSLTLTLNNGADGELLWRFYKSMDENVMASSTDLVERMMRKVSRNFPYMTKLSDSHAAISVIKTGKGYPIIFLPGFTAPGSVWDETIKKLDRTYTRHVVSYAGFNGIEPIGTPWYNAIKNQLSTYIKNQKLSNVTIIGHSMGGDLAIELAAELPGQVKGLILVESVPCMREIMMPGVPASSLQYNSPYNSKLLAMADEDFKKMAMAMSQNMTNTQSKVELLTNWSIKADRKTYVYGYTELLQLDLRSKLLNVNTHTLILGASFPNQEMIKASYEKQYANLKHKEILIADASKHFIMFDQPEWLYGQVNKYLQQYAR